MFTDLKHRMREAEISVILAESVFNRSPEAAARKISEYESDEAREFFGWEEAGEILGVCGYKIHDGKIEILNIAVAENARKKGIGRKMIFSLRALHEKSGISIEAETDDDTVCFYRKCGFTAEAEQKYGITRYKCVLR